jgi:hypothetical protein
MNGSPQLRSWQPLLLAGLLVFFFLGGFFHVSDVDVGYHMRTGAYVLAGHGIPSENTFSYTTPNQTWLLQQWAPATIYYLVYAWGGLTALIAFKAFLGAAIMFLVWCSARSLTSKESLWPFWVVTVGLLIARVRFFERPDLFTALLFALTSYLDLRFGRDRRWQWGALPLIMALWANTHAGVIYGFVLLIVCAASEWVDLLWEWYWKKTDRGPVLGLFKREVLKSLMIRPISVIISFASAVVALELINPNGFRVMLVPITQFTSKFWQSVILEYHPPSWEGSKLFYLSLVGLVVLQVITWRKLRIRLLLLTLVFGYLACSSQRSILVYTIIAAPHAAYLLNQLPRLQAVIPWRFQTVLLPATWLLLSFLVILRDRTFLPGVGLYPPYYPMEIYRFIEREVPPQNIFNEMRYGGSMLWWLYPRFKPFIDGRGDAYTEEFWQNEYLPVLRVEPAWREIFQKYQVHGVLLPIHSRQAISKFAQALFSDPQWALVAYNDDTLLFLERTESNREIISQNEFRLVWPGDWAFSAVTTQTLEPASKEAKRAFARSPNSIFALTGLTRVSMIAGDYARAAELLSILTRERGAGENYWRDYGYSLFRLKRLDEADKVFSHMIKNRLLPGFAYYMKHYVSLEHQNPAQAETYLAKALEIEPANASYQAARTNLNARLQK